MEDDVSNACGEGGGTPAKTQNSRPSTAAYDDQGEPDFAGWLSAQTQAKSKVKTPLPRGLTKTKSAVAVPTRFGTGVIAATTTTAKGGAVGSKPKASVAKQTVSKPEPAPAADEEDWGDAWG